jgi:hypothetical protein
MSSELDLVTIPVAGIAVVACRKANERRHSIFSRNALTPRLNWRIAGNGSAACSMSKRSQPIKTRPNDAIQGAMTLGPSPFCRFRGEPSYIPAKIAHVGDLDR